MASISISQISPQNIQNVTQLQSEITINALTQSGGIIQIGSISQTVPFNVSWVNITGKPAYVDYISDLTSSAQTQINNKADVTATNAAIALKADKTYVDTQDATKADTSYVDTQLALKANYTDVTTSLATKADKTYVDTQDANLQTQITSAVSSISAKANTTYVDSADSALQTQINTANTNITSKASVSYVDAQVATKENTSNKATTMAGNTTSNIVFLTAKAIYDWSVGLFAPLVSPTFTGTVTLPSTTSVGTVTSSEIGYLSGVTSALQTQINNKASLASPALTGIPTAPTAAAGTNTTQIATTAYVLNAVAGGIDLSSYATISYVDTGLAGKASTSHTHADATITTSGFMSASDKTKLNGVATGATANTGTVTSVGLTVPTGLTVTGSPVTTSGTIAVTLTTGYSIPTTASQTNWDTAYADRNKWDGGATGLVAATGRTSLGLGSAALSATTDFAAASHTHAASDITSGILATARGGTGLGSFTSGGAVYATSISALTTGTLPISAGGTGLTSIANNGAVYAGSTGILTSGTLPIASGGTGASTQAGAQNALNVYDKSSTYQQFEVNNLVNAKITQNTWTSWTPTISGFTAGNAVYDCSYLIVGKTVTLRFKMTAGTTTTYGALSVTTPTGLDPVKTTKQVFPCILSKSGSSDYFGFATIASANTILVNVASVSGSYTIRTSLSSTVPFTWAANDAVQFQLTYEIA
jgi:hypothetical protein